MMDIRMNYSEKGSGRPLILIHGNGGSLKYFKKQIDCFSNEYRVIAVDTRGHGKSPRGEAPFTIEQFAEDLKSFMDEKNIAKANLLGFSDGGNIGLGLCPEASGNDRQNGNLRRKYISGRIEKIRSRPEGGGI